MTFDRASEDPFWCLGSSVITLSLFTFMHIRIVTMSPCCCTSHFHPGTLPSQCPAGLYSLHLSQSCVSSFRTISRVQADRVLVRPCPSFSTSNSQPHRTRSSPWPSSRSLLEASQVQLAPSHPPDMPDSQPLDQGPSILDLRVALIQLHLLACTPT